MKGKSVFLEIRVASLAFALVGCASSSASPPIEQQPSAAGGGVAPIETPVGPGGDSPLASGGAAVASGGAPATGGAGSQLSGAAGGGIGGGGAGAAPAPWTCTGAGMSLQFDGDQVDEVIADLMGDMPAGTASRTIEMWAYTTAKSWRIGHPLFDVGTAGGGKVLGLDFATKWENSQLVQDGYPSLNVYSDKSNDFGWWAPFTPNQPNFGETGWVHAAIRFDQATNQYAVLTNAETVFSAEASLHGHEALRTEATPLHVGFSQDFGQAGFDGKIDELRIWNRARTNAEIKDTMHRALNGNEDGLIGYWHFDEGVGTTSRDFSPGHHDAVMNSDVKPLWVKSEGLELTCP